RRPDGAAEQPASRGADRRAGQTVSRPPAAENGPQRAAGKSAGYGTRVLVRGVRIGSAAGGTGGDQRDTNDPHRLHDAGPLRAAVRPRIELDGIIGAKLCSSK